MKLYLPFTKAFQDLHRLGSGGDGSLELKTMPPRNPDNIPICTTYHVMIMALQNAILEHYATPQELFNDDRINFMIKREHRKDPIMYAGKQGGRGLKTLKSASAASFSTYLSKRALENGFSEISPCMRSVVLQLPKSIGLRAGTLFAAPYTTYQTPLRKNNLTSAATTT